MYCTLPLKILSTVDFYYKKIKKKSTKPDITKISKVFTTIHYWSFLIMNTIILALSVKKPRPICEISPQKRIHYEV
jgi:hypothetical protein